ncbi:thioesterase family protein [Vagococcus vulneris]|uniref:Fluoroacetyl-CoA-specific thioesterase-like domain-containing protein n=1 Tax=Vagococcus vulneris TaxID=1977869 RepID=A0A429ZZ76_9ENTE|nr:thioesterase family protein [Vagococcus vulneris]RST99317.1 hypothetical protein CBF37_04940 [Vagococcus vulneris]
MYEKEFLVMDTMTAKVMGSGDLPVLATPSLIAAVEETCRDFMKQRLSQEQTSVGVSISCQHLHPTGIGQSFVVKIIEKKFEKRKSEYIFEVADKRTKIAEGTHIRVIVNRQRFMKNLEN